jgi:hypothetical protein
MRDGPDEAHHDQRRPWPMCGQEQEEGIVRPRIGERRDSDAAGA